VFGSAANHQTIKAQKEHGCKLHKFLSLMSDESEWPNVQLGSFISRGK
jgi:hypothetical protein